MLVAVGSAVRAQSTEDLRKEVVEATGLKHPDLLKDFYHRRGYEPAWVADEQPTASARALVATLRRAEQDGLDLNDLHSTGLDALFESAHREGPGASAARLALDLHLTDAFLHYGTVLLQGLVDPRSLHTGWNLQPRHADLVALLEAALQADTMEMETTIERWQETRISVAEPIPVYVLYVTAWVDAEGVVQFRPDLYGHDARLDRALSAKQAGGVL